MKFLLYKTNDSSEIRSKIEENADKGVLLFSGLSDNFVSQAFISAVFAKIENTQTRKTLELEGNVYRQSLDEFIFHTENLFDTTDERFVVLLFISELTEGTHVMKTKNDAYSFVLTVNRKRGKLGIHLGRDRRRSHLKNYYLHSFDAIPNKHFVEYEIVPKEHKGLCERINDLFS